MSRTIRTGVKIGAIIIVAVACIALAYYIGSGLTGHKLATLSDNMNYSRWQDKYYKVTCLAGAISGASTLGWFMSARYLLKADEATGAGKRLIWLIWFGLSIAGSLAAAHFYSPQLGIRLNGIIYAVYGLIFSGLGYWLATIATTPTVYKYTPIGARLLRRFL